MAEEIRESRDRVRHDLALRSVLLVTGDREISVAGLTPEVIFQRIPQEGAEQWALFATAEELEVLAKMISYILEKVKISEGSKATLAGLLPRVEALRSVAHD